MSLLREFGNCLLALMTEQIARKKALHAIGNMILVLNHDTDDVDRYEYSFCEITRDFISKSKSDKFFPSDSKLKEALSEIQDTFSKINVEEQTPEVRALVSACNYRLNKILTVLENDHLERAEEADSDVKKDIHDENNIFSSYKLDSLTKT